MNNRIKVIKRMACGYRDDEYFLPEDPRRFPPTCAMNQKRDPPGGGSRYGSAAFRPRRVDGAAKQDRSTLHQTELSSQAPVLALLNERVRRYWCLWIDHRR